MVALASLCINVGMGLTFGAYSTFMSSTTIAEFSASHVLASSGLSLAIAINGFCAPVVRMSTETCPHAAFIEHSGTGAAGPHVYTNVELPGHESMLS